MEGAERRGPFWPGVWCTDGLCMVSTHLEELSASLVCCYSFCCCYLSFLISPLFLVSCSYYNPCSLPFEPSILLFIPLQGAGRLRKQHIVQSVFSGSTKLEKYTLKPQHSFIWIQLIYLNKKADCQAHVAPSQSLCIRIHATL